MNHEKLHEVECPLYVYDGAEPPAEYKAESKRINAYAAEASTGFWEKHLKKAANKTSRKFDWIFGVVLPVICFFADPIVFRNGFDFGETDDAFLSDYRPFAYLLSFISIMALLAWMIWGEKLKGLAVLISGILAVGAAVSLVIGLFLLPFSLFGLIFFIGILGFTPFFTFIVFWRNARQAFLAARPFFEIGLLTRTAGLVALFTLVVPMVVNAAMGKNIVARLLDIITR
jgi:hypothetical protein